MNIRGNVYPNLREELAKELVALIQLKTQEQVRENKGRYLALVAQFLSSGGSQNDILVKIGKTVFEGKKMHAPEGIIGVT